MPLADADEEDQDWRLCPMANRRLHRDSVREPSPDRDKHSFIWLAATVLFLVAAWASPGGTQEDVPLEYRVKATFLYNFTKLVEWPAESFPEGNPELVIAIVGEDPFGATLDRIATNEGSRGRKLTIKRLKWNENLGKCHVLFISRSEKKHLQAILSKVDGAGILTVSEMEGFASSGGMIEFLFDEDRIRFDINREAATHGKLKINSRLLMLARTVY